MESVQKVYNLQPITRLIATSEVEPDKKNQIWRSPLPFMHPEDCPHHKSSKKSKSSKKKGMNQATLIGGGGVFLKYLENTPPPLKF